MLNRLTSYSAFFSEDGGFPPESRSFWLWAPPSEARHCQLNRPRLQRSNASVNPPLFEWRCDSRFRPHRPTIGELDAWEPDLSQLVTAIVATDRLWRSDSSGQCSENGRL